MIIAKEGKLMYLWNVKALARDLKENKVTEKESMICLLVTISLAVVNLVYAPDHKVI